MRDIRKDRRFVTTMIDYYGLPKNFPGYDAAKSINKVNDKVDVLERSLYEDINDQRFIPYIQVHEYEALLFSSPETIISKLAFDTKQEKRISDIVGKYENPEDINDKEPPSKRLIDIAKGHYRKRARGPMIAQDIGLPAIRKHCPHFNEWVRKLEALSSSH